ncbi:hypothetical protein S2091_3407 [Solimicrobium silvestre]|uniref:CobQ/CobB/MinD/ParA nucleotide binding domain n=2 Tax=Solimicrobium silvestre TaxID=2099400 RepID=A0A2S9GVW8_9BURK|nr:hypothetical protein S2091_3407 [Solimicrobium silvestre]
MLFGAKPRFVTFLSALCNEEKNATLVNLSAGLGRLGSDVVLLDARQSGASVAKWLEIQIVATLLDVAHQKRTIQQATMTTSQGFKLASFCRYQNTMPDFQPTTTLVMKLNKIVEKLGNSADIVLVDGELDDSNGLATVALEEGEIVIQVTNHPDSIKTAYSLIKRAHGKFGRRYYGVLVTGVNEFEAHRVYDAMAQAAGNFLSVPLNFVGYVPQDDFLRRASRSGRTVLDAFPTAGAAMAFSRLAQQMTGIDEFASLHG